MGLFTLLATVLSIPFKIIDTTATVVEDGIVNPVKDVVDSASDSITRK